MPVSVTMPQLGESVTEGTVTRWLKKEGEHVETDEPLLEVSTDKVDTEIPSPASGILTSITVAEDETVEVGAELAVIGEAGEAPAPAAEPKQEAPAEEPAPQAEAPAPQQSAPPQQQPAAQQAPPPAAWPPPAAPATPAPPAQPPAPAAPAPAPAAAAPQQPAAAPAEAPSGDGPYVTPLVRKLAAEHSVDLNTVTGTGVGGRIRKQDVLEAARAAQAAAAAAAAPAPAAPQAPAAAPARTAPPAPAAAPAEAAALRGKTEKMTRIRQTIARRMVESLQVSAQLTTVVEVDITKVARLREQAKADFQAREGVKLSFMPFFALAAIEALKAHPKLNAVINSETNEVTYHDVENLGIAVDVVERGLMVPVIHNAGQLNLGGIAQRIADVAERTRTNKVSPDELAGGTFTLTNTGSRGALFDTPILNQPQVGMLGTGAVVKRPAVIDDPDLGEVIAVRSMVYLALTYDHRLVDGADAARFLGTIKHRLEEGNFEAELGL
ncbi:2-oxoglutarate dehydrogenase, E2 component, dihydrolipoamide succinyltransferase [Actinomadura barringtoniae]|uniref:Dihydrolipoamide acetyltransferase component of pyruvate dehydrogenase complex n=1 Tax=Actinomadura barringtoniae TaxID=1427535 RepID=A0A939PQ21_9ACTN|nr:2-oxoglutarate dehydrogenase, E2 component, dihydrolipoamide succinyltransferase [Actinomadura barringtoniae]MBO2452611.1 2-oxoglutarate dehydrogenase, E2 component, dihydrolipoamide succinyltransferase [Actinomadura barringtoniae]